EACNVVSVGGAGRGDDTGTDMFAQLDGKTRHTAGPALDENGLATLELERILDGDQRCQANEGEGRGLDVGESMRLAAKNGGFFRNFFGVGAIAPCRQYAEYGVANPEVGNACAKRRDDA